MKFLGFLFIAILLFAFSASGQNVADTAALTKLLNEFLDGASRNDTAMHDRFWAEDLIYTRSSGVRVGKPEIMNNARTSRPPNSSVPAAVYTSEDVKIQQYGDTAVVAFRLVGTTKTAAGTQVTNNLNTGTFVKRNDKWQVVAWQSTRMAVPEVQAKETVLDLTRTFFKAVIANDSAIISSLVDSRFVWRNSNNSEITLSTVLEKMKIGTFKTNLSEIDKMEVIMFGETAVVLGASKPASNVSVSVVFANIGGAWKVASILS